MNTLLQNDTDSAKAQAAVDYATPDVNIYETKDGYVLEAEMPGVNKEGLKITLEGRQITLTGQLAKETGAGEILFRERQQAGYQRIFELDPAIDATRISARMNQGILSVALPKSEAIKSRQIAVSE